MSTAYPSPMARLIGRLHDLERRERRAGERAFADDNASWSFADNGAWLADGVDAGDVFLQISTAPPRSVLAWEIEQLRGLGCVRVGPFWVPRPWLFDRDRYVRVVRLVADHVLALPRGHDDVYVTKARGELEPMLAMWPFVLLLPTTSPLSATDLIAARAWPVHPLGVVAAPTHADGRTCSPADFFFHDVDHARFKVREDLLARGVGVGDPYAGGTTFDTARGAHRCVMDDALPHVDGRGWRRAPSNARSVRRWLRTLADEPCRELGDAARWLLFELVHEKSLPIDARVLAAATSTPAHSDKLRAKCTAGFYAVHRPSAGAAARLDDARMLLHALFEAPA